MLRSLLVAFASACADPPPDAQPDGTTEVSDTAAARAAPAEPVAALRAVLDSAHKAFEEGDAVGALTLYHVAAERDSTLAAAWFGVFMSQRALGDTAAADSAFRRARRLAEAPLAGSAPSRR